VIADLGANRGEFYEAFIRCFSPSRYIAVEANPVLAEALSVHPTIDVFNYAVAAADAPVMFRIDDNPEASRASDAADPRAVRVQGITLETLLAKSGAQRIDLLKVDIDGAEFPMLMQAPIDVLEWICQITIEFHDFLGLNTSEEVQRMVRRLESAGFIGIRFSLDNNNWCFLRRDLARRSGVRVFVAKNVTAPLRRLRHRVGAWRSAMRKSARKSEIFCTAGE
jgi:FkbM family methyltransferase